MSSPSTNRSARHMAWPTSSLGPWSALRITPRRARRRPPAIRCVYPSRFRCSSPRLTSDRERNRGRLPQPDGERPRRHGGPLGSTPCLFPPASIFRCGRRPSGGDGSGNAVQREGRERCQHPHRRVHRAGRPRPRHVHHRRLRTKLGLASSPHRPADHGERRFGRSRLWRLVSGVSVGTRRDGFTSESRLPRCRRPSTCCSWRRRQPWQQFIQGPLVGRSIGWRGRLSTTPGTGTTSSTAPDTASGSPPTRSQTPDTRHQTPDTRRQTPDVRLHRASGT